MTGPGANGTPSEDPTPDPPSDEVPGATDVEGSGPLVETRLARRRRALRPVRGRTTAVVVAVAVVAGVGIFSAAAPAPSSAPAAPAGDGVGVSPLSARTSSLFCASGAGLDAGNGATTVVVLTNTSRTTANGVMTAVQGSGAPMARSHVSVPPPSVRLK